MAMLLNEIPVLQVTDLSVCLSNHVILNHFSLSVSAGSIHAIVGPNGAGKTTLMRSLLGEMPHSGQIHYYFRRGGGVGYVPQSVSFDRALPITVGDLCHVTMTRWPVFWGRSKKMKQRITQALSLTSCEHLLDCPMGGLSGGELRRVLIAQALIKRPEVLLLDEPDSNMDGAAFKNLENLLLSLRRQHDMTLILICHDPVMLSRICDQITIMSSDDTGNDFIDFFTRMRSQSDMPVFGDNVRERFVNKVM